ncbi:MAG: DUF1156 domain-containing protein [Candidatus Nitrosocaldus sp.]
MSDKRVIEEADMNLLGIFDSVSKEAKKEKLGRPPINEICYWWTRKPLIINRALLLASTLCADKINANVISSLLQINKDVRAYTKNPNIETYKRLLGKDPSTIKVLDCFAGGGNIIFELSRWMLSCYAVEYNPVAYIIEKAIVEYPRRDSELAEAVKCYGEEVIKRTKEELKEFYYYHNDSNRLTYLYAWCIICPYCKQRIPLLNHMWLANTDKKKIGLRIKPVTNNDFTVEIINNISEKEGEEFTHKNDKVICIKCRNTIDYTHMTSDITKRKDYEMLAVVIKGKSYVLANNKDKEALKRVEEELKKHWYEFEEQGLIPYEEMGAELFRLKNYGFTQWYRIYNPRQLLLMITLLKHIKGIAKEIEDKYGREYAKVIATYLSLLIAKHVDRNCICIGWNVAGEEISHVLAMRSPRIIYNFAEVNPFEKTSGSLYNMLENIVDAIKFASSRLSNNTATIDIRNASALHLSEYYPNNYFDLIITDPPYLDDVQYGEISEFFYVWLYRALKDYYPELPARVPLDEDIVVSKGRFGNKKDAEQFYENALTRAFSEMYKVLKDDGLAVIFFAHSSTEAWKLLLEILMKARFQVKQSYAMHTESSENVLARGKTSFMSSICIACRKLPLQYKKEEYFENIVVNVENRIKNLLDKIDLDRLLSISFTDLILMMFGKAFEEITQYTHIKSYKADFNIDFKVILDHVRSSIVRLLCEKIMGESLEALGKEISFYLLVKIFYNGSLNSDEALLLVKALNTDTDYLIKKGVIIKERNNISLLSFDKCERIISKRDDEIDINNLHEQLIYIEYVADSKGATSINRFFQLPNFNKSELTHIMNIIYSYYKSKKDKGLSNDENKEYNILASIMDVIEEKRIAAHESYKLDRYM